MLSFGTLHEDSQVHQRTVLETTLSKLEDLANAEILMFRCEGLVDNWLPSLDLIISVNLLNHPIILPVLHYTYNPVYLITILTYARITVLRLSLINDQSIRNCSYCHIDPP